MFFPRASMTKFQRPATPQKDSPPCKGKNVVLAPPHIFPQTTGFFFERFTSFSFWGRQSRPLPSCCYLRTPECGFFPMVLNPRATLSCPSLFVTARFVFFLSLQLGPHPWMEAQWFFDSLSFYLFFFFLSLSDLFFLQKSSVFFFPPPVSFVTILSPASGLEIFSCNPLRQESSKRHLFEVSLPCPHPYTRFSFFFSLIKAPSFYLFYTVFQPASVWRGLFFLFRLPVIPSLVSQYWSQDATFSG